jgi:hypothetical protein
MEIKMKTVSNIAAGVGFLMVIVSFILNAAGLTHINMDDALKAGGFVKAVFLPVDASVWITNAFKTRGGAASGGIVLRDENNA